MVKPTLKQQNSSIDALETIPYLKTDPPPIQTFLITPTLIQQSITIQEKLYAMIPKDALHPSCEFVPGRGFRGIHPVVRFNNGSMIHIKTANQGLGLASATLSYVGQSMNLSVENAGGNLLAGF